MDQWRTELACGDVVTVRRAEEADVRAVAALIGEMENRAYPLEAFYERWSEQLRDGHHTCLVACMDDVVMGCLNLRCEWQLHHDRPVAEIMEMAVAGGSCGKGVGGVLFTAACRLARQLGCELIEVHSKNERAAAHRFYEREGMVKTHVHFTLPLGVD